MGHQTPKVDLTIFLQLLIIVHNGSTHIRFLTCTNGTHLNLYYIIHSSEPQLSMVMEHSIAQVLQRAPGLSNQLTSVCVYDTEILKRDIQMYLRC